MLHFTSQGKIAKGAHKSPFTHLAQLKKESCKQEHLNYVIANP